jgi:protein translocase SecG subunit
MRSLLIAQAVVAVLLSVSILLQNRGSGLGAAFGGDFGGFYTKRGLEKFLIYGTVILAVAFLALGVINVRLSVIG